MGNETMGLVKITQEKEETLDAKHSSMRLDSRC